MAKAATTRKKRPAKKASKASARSKTAKQDDAVVDPGEATPNRDDVAASTNSAAAQQSADVAVQRRQVISDLFQRGLAAHQAGQIDDAIRLYSTALRQNPNQPDVWNNLGVALRRSKKFDAALIAYRRAADIRPQNAGMWSNMGNCLREMMRFDEALVAHNKALELDDTIKSHTFNAGLVYRDMNRFEEALDYFERALTIDPDYVDANWDRALAHLALGNYGEGWAGYETRRKLADNPIRPLESAPEWDGKLDLRGKRILLRAEQGFGDMIQFARFVPLVAKKAGHVILECRKELIPIMKTVPGVGTVVEKGRALPEFDVHVPLLSLPHVMGIGENDLQKISTDSYLSPPQGKRARLAPPPGTALKVGLIWAGKLNPRDRSCPLETLLPILSAKGAAFYSFQVDERRGDIDKLGLHAFVTDLGDHINDFGDSAALMREMDLVITIDSSPAHLAGALGIPVWMLQLYTTDWRWMVDRSDSPWYPTMRIYRQEQPGDWSKPVEKLGRDFSTLLQARMNSQ
ncbi:tetratricopeptide repeat protein [Thalassospira sp. HF15]|uniref:tetratricopeptide repeat-containing glycosyltransferase family protein n=1 Tax=Thalassospira sp. HF15 TaxID=2722755 RepID=UPI00142FF54E|nr:tetratricopeptide repeat-containing glycosyltransferase family protein [Thalassospira sp. HF15]NIY74727.1 tetratricopeptide repeat protein [Thalassospira sp. HF15]